MGGLLHWEPGKICSDSLRMWASLSIGALLFFFEGNLVFEGEARIPGDSERWLKEGSSSVYSKIW